MRSLHATVGTSLTSLKQQVANQYRAIKANPGMSGFAAAFTSPMVITGGADVYSQFVSQFVFSGRVQVKIATDGKFLIVGQLRFLDGLLTMSAKVYADLSKISEGAATVLFLADIPDDPRVLTLYGKFQMGFRSASGEEVHFDVVDETPNTVNVLRPSGKGMLSLGGLAILAAAACYALSAIAVRVLGRTDSTQSMVFWMLAMLSIFSLALAWREWAPVDAAHWKAVAILGVSGAIGQYGVTEAFRRAPASVIAPLEYTALIWGLGLDWVLWGTLPDRWMLVGAGVIIACGIYLLRRERVHVEAEHP